MNRINENEFIEIIKELKGKSIYITLEAELEGKITLYKMEYDIKDNVIKLTDKKSDNYINIDLNQSYKTLANDTRDKIQANIDTMNSDIVTTIETASIKVIEIIENILQE